MVEVIIELAEWMLRNGYSKRDIEDELLYAADTLLIIEPGWEEEEEDIPEETEHDESQSKKSKSRISSNKSKLSKRESKKKTDMKSKVSGRSKVTSKKSVGRTPRKSGTKSSKKSSLAFSKRGEEEARPLYLGCSHYDKLFRIHIILSLLSDSIQKQQEYLMRALNFCLYMWQTSILLYKLRLFIESHKEELQQQHGYKLSIGGAAGGEKTTRGLDNEIVKFVIMDILSNNDIMLPKEPLVPFDEEGWINFNIPTEFIEFSKKYEDADIFSFWSFMKPSLSFYYLNSAFDLMGKYHMWVQQIPILKTLICFSDIVAKNEKLIELYRVRLLRVQSNITLPAPKPKEGEEEEEEASSSQSAVEQINTILNNLVMTEEEQRIEYENIKLQAIIPLEKKSLQPIQNLPEPAFIYRTKAEPDVLEQIVRTHERWILQAEEYVHQKRFVDAKQLLDEAARHCIILNDYNGYSKVMHLIGWLFGEAKQFSDTLQYHLSSQRYAVKCDMITNSCCLASIHLCELHRFSEARNMLENITESLINKMGLSKKAVGKTTTNIAITDYDFTITSSLILLFLHTSLVAIDEAKEYLTIPLRLKQLVKISIAAYKKADNYKAKLGGLNAEQIDLSIKYLAILQTFIDKVWSGEKKDKKVKMITTWIGALEDAIVELKCLQGVEVTQRSKLILSLDVMLNKLKVMQY